LWHDRTARAADYNPDAPVPHRSSLALAVIACGSCAHPPPAATRPTPPPVVALVPAPARADLSSAAGFIVGNGTVIFVTTRDPAVLRVADFVSTLLRNASGGGVPVRAPSNAPSSSSVMLSLDPAAATADEGYELTITAQAVTLKARAAAGLFYGAQTIRQLLPYTSEYGALRFGQPGSATLPAAHIVDAPRYGWRGAMLDVARHFFVVADVKRFIDLMALHKLNRLHLHLSDDQGWRIEIRSRPELTRIGASTQVGGGRGGFYTQVQYGEIVAYAAERYITVVPEIDMPGHTNAALSAYAELNCSGAAAAPYTGIRVGFSALCTSRETTYAFIDDVVGEIAAMTPGAYFHAGGDEVRTLSREAYVAFVERVQQIVAAHGKTMIGWDEIASATLLPASIVQHWRPQGDAAATARAPHLILSPAAHAYLDMKYEPSTALGQDWAGLIPVRTAYDWDPAATVPGAAAGAVVGIEAPLWTETVETMHDVEFLVLPRLAAIADLAWSPAASHDWDRFAARVAAQAPRWTALGINFHRAPGIDWRPMP
jgi:hexosaminidase